MKVGLIDVDGHHFPNLALMRISAYHKQKGDDVEWWMGDLWHYDIVYKSKVFSDAYSKDVEDPINADKVYKGGTGYAISLSEDGKERYDKSKDNILPQEIEHMFPDYSIYPQHDFAVSMTSRGCPRGCDFCHVASKEGRCAVKVADVKDFWNGQTEIKVLDPNITACREKRDLMRQYKETGALIDFTQGIDIRLVNDDDIHDLSEMRIKRLHFAWDNPKVDLTEQFKRFSEKYKRKARSRKMAYVLVNFNSTMDENLWRISTLFKLGFDPYVMVYNKPSAPKEIKDLQRWCNNKIIFGAEPDFKKYNSKIGSKKNVV